MAHMPASGNVVVDLFAGIGFYTLPLVAKAGAARAMACEWNPAAVEALRRNIDLNGLQGRVEVLPGDCREVCRFMSFFLFSIAACVFLQLHDRPSHSPHHSSPCTPPVFHRPFFPHIITLNAHPIFSGGPPRSCRQGVPRSAALQPNGLGYSTASAEASWWLAARARKRAGARRLCCCFGLFLYMS